MSSFLSIFRNSILLCGLSGWVVAQFLKFVIGIIRTKHIDFSLFTSSGGMPSSHSATVCALTTATGIVCGFDSAAFAIAFILAMIVMYDAAGVRRAAGEQAKILNRMMRDLEEGNTATFDVHLKELLGHTPLEVFAGSLLGILIPVVVYGIAYHLKA